MLPRLATEGGEDEFNVVNAHLWLVDAFSNTHASRQMQGTLSKTELFDRILLTRCPLLFTPLSTI